MINPTMFPIRFLRSSFVPFLLQIRIIDLTTCTKTIFRYGYNLILGFAFILFSSLLSIHRIFQTLNAFSNRQKFYVVHNLFALIILGKRAKTDIQSYIFE